MYDYAGNIHMHTRYSDGTGSHRDIVEAAGRAGLDFVIVTDHNIWISGIEGYYQTKTGRRVMLLIGEEVHDMRRDPQCNHCLVLGAEQEMAPYTPNPQELLDQVNRAGGYAFLAHPHDPAAPLVKEPDYAWYDWDIHGYTGLELWNYMSDVKGLVTSYWQAYQTLRHPERYVTAPSPRTLAKWDELLGKGQKVSVVGGSDGHALDYHFGPLKFVVYPYEDMFRAVNTHILLPEPLTGDFQADKPRVLQAIGRGNSWVGYDLPHPTQGFRFSGQSRTKGVMGQEVKMDAGATLQVITPTKAEIRIMHNGKVAAEIKDHVSLTHIPLEPGAYRAECYIQFQGKRRGWIFSNPIYLVN